MPRGWNACWYKGRSTWIRETDARGRRASITRNWLFGWAVHALTLSGKSRNDYLETRRACLAFVRETEESP